MTIILQGLFDGTLISQGFVSGSAPPPTQQSFEVAFKAELLSLSALTDLIGTAIYKTGIPSTHDLGTNGPALTYHVPHKSYGHNLSGSDGTITANVMFGAFAYTVSAPKLILDAIRDGIDGALQELWGNGTVEIMSCFQSSDIDEDSVPRAGSDQWMYISYTEYTIKYRI